MDSLVHLCSPVVVSLVGNVSLQILLPFLLLLLGRAGYWLLLGAVCRDLATARSSSILSRQTTGAVRAWQRRALLLDPAWKPSSFQTHGFLGTDGHALVSHMLKAGQLLAPWCRKSRGSAHQCSHQSR